MWYKHTEYYYRLTLIERNRSARGIYGESFTQIAKRIDFDVSAVAREIYENVKRKRAYSAIKQEIALET